MSQALTPRRSVALVVAAALGLLAGCSSTPPAPPSGTPPAAGPAGAASASGATAAAGAATAVTTGGGDVFPVTVGPPEARVTIRTRPAAVISLSATATEDLFAVGAGPQVIAVDDQSNFPPSAPVTSLSALKPSVEAIAGRRPDLVVISDDSSGLSASLAKVGITTLVAPAAKTLEDAYAQIVEIGQATGHAAAGSAVVATMRAAIAAVVGATARPNPPLRIYHELDQTLYSATSSTFIGQLYVLLGAVDVADAADSAAAGGYPQLSQEYVVKADPDVIFLADGGCCGQSEATVAARPGWSTMSAVRHHAVVVLNDDVASRWGPRVVQLVKAIAAGLDAAGSGG